MCQAACLLAFSPPSAHIVTLYHALTNMQDTQHCWDTLSSAAHWPGGLSTGKGCDCLSTVAHTDIILSPDGGGRWW